METADARPRRWSARSAWTLALAALLVTLVALCWPPVYQTNDDVGMLMRAHGFGMFEEPTHLIFSSVPWEWIVRAIPETGGVLGYSIATMLVLVAAAWGVLWSSSRAWADMPRASALLGLGIAIVVVAPAVIRPQFTVNAGFMGLVAVLALAAWGREGSRGALVAAVVAIFVGMLIRRDMAVVTALVGLSLLPWRALLARRGTWIAAAVLALLTAGTMFLDARAYSGPGWERFDRMQAARVPYLDYGLATRVLRQHPAELRESGISRTEMLLLDRWFFPDLEIWSPTALNELRERVPPRPQGAIRRTYLVESVRTFGDPAIAPMVLAALVLLVAFPSRRAVLAWGLVLLLVIAFAVLGRPGIVRVYQPLVAVLVVAPVAAAMLRRRAPFVPGREPPADDVGDGPPPRRARRLRLRTPAVVCAALGAVIAVGGPGWSNAYDLDTADMGRIRSATSELAREQRDSDGPALVSWANVYNYYRAFPVLDRGGDARDLRLAHLGTTTWAPGSVSLAEWEAGRGVLVQMRGDDGVAFVSSSGLTLLSYRLRLLGMLCEERYGGTLEHWQEHPVRGLLLVRVRCRA